MSKDDMFALEGQVVELLPNALFKVRLENNAEILCHLNGRMRINNINIRLLDHVTIEMSTYDMTKGRIVFRHKTPTNKTS
jgi:translation initiation factor IF-1